MTEVMSMVSGTGPTEECRSCGAPLAADQRYCLNCGTRRGDARTALFEELTAPVADAPVAGVVPAGAAPSLVDRFGGPAGIAAIVFAALGVGVLIGSGGDDPSPTPVRAPVVNISGVAAGAAGPTGPTAAVAPAAAPTTTDAAAATDSGSSSTDAGASTSSTDSGSSSSGSGSSSSSTTSGSGSNLTPEEFQKKSKKLPAEVSTGGKTLAPDNKPAGGGSSATEIG